ncbi:MAG: hypothetical protein ABSD59_20930 [Terracidiphilus sp.]
MKFSGILQAESSEWPAWIERTSWAWISVPIPTHPIAATDWVKNRLRASFSMLFFNLLQAEAAADNPSRRLNALNFEFRKQHPLKQMSTIMYKVQYGISFEKSNYLVH